MTYEMYELMGLEMGVPHCLLRISWEVFPGKGEPYQPARLRVCFQCLLYEVRIANPSVWEALQMMEKLNLSDEELIALGKEFARTNGMIGQTKTPPPA